MLLTRLSCSTYAAIQLRQTVLPCCDWSTSAHALPGRLMLVYCFVGSWLMCHACRFAAVLIVTPANPFNAWH
jgi:hypothetical protein